MSLLHSVDPPEPLVMRRLQARVVLDTPSVPSKMPRSAYQLWMKQSGPEILKKLGGTFTNVGERSKLLSVEWKKVSEEERSRYESPHHVHGPLCVMTVVHAIV